MKHYISVALILVFILITNTKSVIACSCIAPAPPLESLKEADAVFAGKVVSIEATSGMDPVKVTFEIWKVWKGPEDKNLVVETAGNEAACGFSFKKDEYYIVYASENGDGLSTGLCTRTKLLSVDAQEDLAQLGEGVTITPGFTVPNPPPNWLEYWFGKWLAESESVQILLLFVIGILVLVIVFLVAKFRK